MQRTEAEQAVIEELYRLKEKNAPYAAYCTNRLPLVLSHFLGWENHDIQMRSLTVLPGTTLRIVMVSRLGDIGLTEVLTDENGYGIRLYPESDSILDIRWTQKSENVLVCAACRGVFLRTRTHEENLEELAEDFGEEALTQSYAEVCGECWRQMAWRASLEQKG